MTSNTAGEAKGIYDEDVVEYDILIGDWGGKEDGHPGNLQYCRKLEDLRPFDESMSTKERAHQVVQMLRDEGCRFLIRDDNDGRCYDVGDHSMRGEVLEAAKEREWEQSKEILTEKQIEFAVVTGDIRTFEADVVALKHAQGFHGADSVVATELESVGIERSELICAPNGHRFRSTRRGIRAHGVLYVGMPRLFLWDYNQVQEFARRTLETLQTEAPETQHLAMTLHGPGMGLSEVDAFLAEFRGCLVAIASGTVPLRLRRITLIEQHLHRTNQLQQTLEMVLTEPITEADPEEKHRFMKRWLEQGDRAAMLSLLNQHGVSTYPWLENVRQKMDFRNITNHRDLIGKYDIIFVQGSTPGGGFISRTVPSGGTLSFSTRASIQDEEDTLAMVVAGCIRQVPTTRSGRGEWEERLDAEFEFQALEPNSLFLVTKRNGRGTFQDSHLGHVDGVIHNFGVVPWSPREGSHNGPEDQAYSLYIQEQMTQRRRRNYNWKEESSWLCKHTSIGEAARNIHPFNWHRLPPPQWMWQPGDIILCFDIQSCPTWYVARPCHSSTKNRLLEKTAPRPIENEMH